MTVSRTVLAVATAAALAACGSHGEDRCRLTGTDWLAWTGYAVADANVILSRSDGSCVRTLAAQPGQEQEPVLSLPHGIALYVAVRGTVQKLVAQTLADGAERVLPTGGLTPSSPALSPDGTVVAFQGWVGIGGQSDIWTVPLAGGTDPTLVVSSALSGGASAFDGGPAWGPDGSLYFVSDRSGSSQVFRSGADGSDPQVVASTSAALGGILGRPAVSPDGLLVAFARTASDSTARVVVRTVATGEERLLADVGESEPSFDATGRYLAVSSYLEGGPKIVVREVSTGRVVSITTPGGGAHASPAFTR